MCKDNSVCRLFWKLLSYKRVLYPTVSDVDPLNFHGDPDLAFQADEDPDPGLAFIFKSS
jgi:hypothetical protein